MKLLNVTTRYYIFLFLAVMSCWSLVLYFVLKFEVYENIDEVLYNRVNNVRSYVEQNKIAGRDPLSDYHLTEVSKSMYEQSRKQLYSDTLVYEATDDEYDEYRKVKTSFEANGRYWQIIVVKPRLESTEMINTVVLTLIPLSALMVVILAVSARRLNNKLWRPFYKILGVLSDYRIDKQTPMPEVDSEIVEFNSLAKSVQSLARRNREVFEQQKQFIENASHETQTPLAVIQSQLEILLQMPELTDVQSGIIQSTLRETDRLTKLNKTLLLLSKIENQQFMDKSEVNLDALSKKLLSYFDEKKEKLNLSLTIETHSNSIITTNPILAEVLVGNLIKNAFVHNVPGGKIRLTLAAEFLEIENTGHTIVHQDKIFERFGNRSSNADSWGLGLSIVKKIVDINGWKISYNNSSGLHTFRVDF